MNISELRFSEEIDWDHSHEVLLFFAYVEGRKVTCGISQIALNDWCGTEDTKVMAIANYNQNKQTVQNLAAKYIEHDKFNDRGEILILSADLMGLLPLKR